MATGPSTVACKLGTKVVCIGRNYADHAAELGNKIPKEPVVFIKPLSSVVMEPKPIMKPADVKEFHHEVELGVVISRQARRITEEDALKYVGGYCVALDMTARDLQTKAKAGGLPWALAKCQDTFTALGPCVPAFSVPDPHKLDLWLRVDGDLRQSGNTSDMLFSVPALLAYISRRFTLEEGDIVLTGTPAGVGPVLPGETITAGIDGVGVIEFPVLEIEE